MDLYHLQTSLAARNVSDIQEHFILAITYTFVGMRSDIEGLYHPDKNRILHLVCPNSDVIILATRMSDTLRKPFSVASHEPHFVER